MKLKPIDSYSADAYLKYITEQAKKAVTKLRNPWISYDGQIFHSRAERDRYTDLKYLEQMGQIEGFKRLHLVKLMINDILITTWRCDFIVYLPGGERRFESCIENYTSEYLIKKRLFKVIYAADIFEPKLKPPKPKAPKKFYNKV